MVSVYAPHTGRTAEESDSFSDKSQKHIQGKETSSIILNDFNSHVSNAAVGFQSTHSGLDYGTQKASMLRFCGKYGNENCLTLGSRRKKIILFHIIQVETRRLSIIH